MINQILLVFFIFGTIYAAGTVVKLAMLRLNIREREDLQNVAEMALDIGNEEAAKELHDIAKRLERNFERRLRESWLLPSAWKDY